MTRPDQAYDTPVYVRPAPVRRHVAVRVGVTVAVLALFVEMVLWFRSHTGPVAALGMVTAVPLGIGSVFLLHWAWKKHAF